MLDPTLLLILLIFTLPLLTALCIALCKADYFKFLILFEMSFVLVGLIALGMIGDQDMVTSLSFMGEPITFSITLTPILLFIAAMVALFILVWQQFQNSKNSLSRYQYILLSFSFSFGLIAFLSGQFMIRYIALDIVGLLAALTVLSSFTESFPLKTFILVFQILRLGDLSLLASILLINHHAETLDISRMIVVASELPLSIRMWVFFGFLFALVIKLAIWPFGIWLERVRQTTTRVPFWISGVLMPALGYYLLYRIIPIIGSDIFFQRFLLYFGLALFLLMLLMDYLRLLKFDRFTEISGIYGCFLLGAVAFGASQYLGIYLVCLVLHRLVLLLRKEITSLKINVALSLSPILFNGLFVWINFDHFSFPFVVGWILLTGVTIFWDFWTNRRLFASVWKNVERSDSHYLADVVDAGIIKSAQWMKDKLSPVLFSSGAPKMSQLLTQTASWLYHNVEKRIDDAWSLLGERLMTISEETLLTIEVDTIEKTGRLMDDALKSLEVYEQDVLKRTFRWDLVWIPILLIAILLWLFVL